MYKINKLDNGLTVVTEEMSSIRSISFGIWVKVGSQNESEKTSGISHFIEHMLFKGTSSRSAKDIADEMDAIGGQMNAFTTKTATCYYVRVLDDNFDKALEIMADMFLNSVFDEDEMSKEKKVIIEEINMYEDSPEELVFEILNKNIWDGSSVSRPILGSIDNVKSFTREDVKKYYNENYLPENIVISLAGNFETEVILKKIKRYFGDIKNKGQVSETLVLKYNRGISYKKKDIEQVHICIGFPGVKVSLEDNYTMALLNTMLGGGMSSRLYQKVREENGLAYSIFSCDYAYKTAGVFIIYAAINPTKVHDCVELILKEVRDLEVNRITQAQLSKTKEQLKSNYLMSLENSASRMNSLGKLMINFDRILTPDEIIQRIDDVDIQEIYDLINRIFVMDQISLSAVGRNEYDLESMIKNA